MSTQTTLTILVGGVSEALPMGETGNSFLVSKPKSVGLLQQFSC